MAVEARHLSNFPPQLIPNRDAVMNANANQGGNFYPYGAQMGFGVPLSAPPPDALLPFQHSLLCDSLPAKTSMKSDSGVTTYNNMAAPRKRPRDSLDQLNVATTVPLKAAHPEFSSVIGQDLALQIQQQQLEIEQIVSHHTKKIRSELQEWQKQQARLVVSAIGEGVLKKLREKDEQIQKMGKLTLALQERVKSLYVENQLWRDLARNNEATANSLRSNLEQVLAHVTEERVASAAPAEEDVESCCGSSDRGDAEAEAECRENVNRVCRRCGERESCVLLLPCRHLCLCTMCGSALLQTCPVCNSNTNATVHVNMS